MFPDLAVGAQDLDVCGCSAVTFEGLSDLLSARQEATEINENDQVHFSVEGNDGGGAIFLFFSITLDYHFVKSRWWWWIPDPVVCMEIQ